MDSVESHHVMLSKQVDGQTMLKTRISHGTKEIGEKLISLMAHQCALHKAEFVRLVECTLSAEGWDEIVRERCPDGRNPFIPNR